MDSEFTIYLRKIMTLLRNYGRGNIDDREILTRARSINEFMMTLTDAAVDTYFLLRLIRDSIFLKFNSCRR